MDPQKIARDLQPNLKGELYCSEPMKKHTTWRVGGPADILIVPKSKADVAFVTSYAGKHSIPLYVIGNGSNILVLDGGIRGIVLKLAGGLNQVNVAGNKVIAEAGIRLPALAKKVLQHGLSGLEGLSAIPGTLGGALIMNAGAHGDSIGQLVKKVTCMSYQGNILTLEESQLHFTYRQSSLAQQNLLVLEAELTLRPDDPGLIKVRMEKCQKERMERQPLNLPNAGSVFKNPAGYAAGFLIEKGGAKGLRKGGAQVSEKHANFIVNVGNASAQDILELITCVQEKVYQAFNIMLETEIKVLGEGL